MPKTSPEQNKSHVLEAFDTLFINRDYPAAEKFWSPRSIQHSAHITPGREGLFDLIKRLPPTFEVQTWPGARRFRPPFPAEAAVGTDGVTSRLDGGLDSFATGPRLSRKLASSTLWPTLIISALPTTQPEAFSKADGYILA